MIKKLKKAARAIFVYIVLTAGTQMFLYSYTNSYNRMTDHKIKPASLVVNDNYAEFQILNKTYILSLEKISPENKAFLWAYLFSPDELRAELLFFPELSPLK